MDELISAQQLRSCAPPSKASRRRWLIVTASLALAIMPVMHSTQPTVAQGGGPGPCKINGVLIDPPLPSGVAARWVFIANFDHPNNATQVVTCLVGKSAAGTTYDVGTHHCTVVATNNANKNRFGAGMARFDGDAYLSCVINPTPLPLDPPNVWVAARVNIPTVAQSATTTLIDSQDISFNVRNDPTCTWTLNSRYDDFRFAHTTASNCGAFTRVESHLLNAGNGNDAKGRHAVGTSSYGPTLNGSPFKFEPVFSFRVALPGEIYTLDWLLIDPDSVPCCGAQ